MGRRHQVSGSLEMRKTVQLMIGDETIDLKG